MTSEVNVAITSSTTEGTTSSHKTPTQTVVYGTCGEIKTSKTHFDYTSSATPTQTVVYGTSGEIKTSKTHFDYTSSATPTQTVVHSSSEGLTQMLSNSIRQVLPQQAATPLYSISTFFKATPTSTEPNPR